MQAITAEQIAHAEQELSEQTLKVGVAMTFGGALLGAFLTRRFRGTLVGAAAGSLAASATAFFFTSTTIATSAGEVVVKPVKLGVPFALASGIAALAAYLIGGKR